MSLPMSRRGVLKLAALGAGAAIGTRLAGPSWMRNAFAANEKSALLVIHCQGGYNQMFTSADSCLGRWGVTSAEVETIGNGLAIHKPTFGTLSTFTKQHMAAIGADVPAGADHGRAIGMQTYDTNGVPWTTRLAAAMGGDAAIKAAHLNVDGNGFGTATASPVNGVSMQSVTSLRSLLQEIPQLGVTPPPDPNKPNRAIAAAANKRIQEMSKAQLDKNPKSLLTLREGYNTAQGLFEKVLKPVNLADIKQAYGIAGNETLGGGESTPMEAKFAAAELLIRTGTNVVYANCAGDYDRAAQFLWTFDSHAPGGTKGLHERHIMNKLVLPGLRTFTSRMLEDPDFNVVVAFIGDFCRTNGHTDSGDETSSGHGSVISASVMGKYVKTGTTGRTYDAGYQNEKFVGGNSPGGLQQLWAYLADVLRVSSNPFGTNPHKLVL